MKNTFKLILFIALCLSNQLVAQDDDSEISDTIYWKKIGTTILNFEKERNEVIVNSQEKFSEFHLYVKFAPVELEEIVIFFKNGDQQKFPVKEKIKKEGFEKELEINGKERAIEKLVFQGRTIPNPNENKAKIEIWGEKENSD